MRVSESARGRSLTRRQALCLPLAAASAAAEGRHRTEEIRRFKAPEAHQAVAVDAEAFYAIGNHILARYDRKTGRRLAAWECERAKPLIHLNSGVVRDGVLYSAHSNFPGIPMVSSIEMWDAKTLRHQASHSFGIYGGSATWLDVKDGRWFVTFGHYGNTAAEPGRDPRWTTLVEFDSEWRHRRGWVYPEEVLSKLGAYTISGGVFAPGGALLCTGHDHPEIYLLGFPRGGPCWN